MSFFRLIPNLVIMAPKDFEELEQMLEFATKLQKPVVIRYPRGGEDKYKFNKHEEINFVQAELLKQGTDITIIGIGKTVARAMKIAEDLEKEDIHAEVINARFLKPLDKKIIKESIEKTKKVITIEDGTKINGLGTAVEEMILEENLENVKIKKYGYPDKFIEHGTVEELEELYHVDQKSIEEEIKENYIKENTINNKEKRKIKYVQTGIVKSI